MMRRTFPLKAWLNLSKKFFAKAYNHLFFGWKNGITYYQLFWSFYVVCLPENIQLDAICKMSSEFEKKKDVIYYFWDSFFLEVCHGFSYEEKKRITHQYLCWKRGGSVVKPQWWLPDWSLDTPTSFGKSEIGKEQEKH